MLGANEENDPSRNNRAQVYSKSQNNKKTQKFCMDEAERMGSQGGRKAGARLRAQGKKERLTVNNA